MRRSTILLMSVIFAVSVVSAAYAGTRITMKNGRTFVVGECNETKTSLTCEMYGGMIELDKSDIESIEGVKYTPGYYEDGPSQDEPSSPEGKTETSGQKKPEGGAAQPDSQDGKAVRGLTPDQLKRLGQINQRKAELGTEREKLVQERNKLNEETQSKMVRTQSQYEAWKGRITDIENRISSFNEEARKLNEEEAGLTSGK